MLLALSGEFSSAGHAAFDSKISPAPQTGSCVRTAVAVELCVRSRYDVAGLFIENAHSKFTLIMIILSLSLSGSSSSSPEWTATRAPYSRQTFRAFFEKKTLSLLSNGHLTASCYRPCARKCRYSYYLCWIWQNE